MTPRDSQALRASLDARLQMLAQERNQDVNRLRRHLTFQRILRRLDDTWVLKGGFLLEARLGIRARATKDLDLARRRDDSDAVGSLTDALAADIDGDGFVFRITRPRHHLADAELLGGPGVSVGVTALLAGREFASVRLDVVARPSEIAGGTEQIVLPTVVAEPGWGPVVVTAVDIAQHVAEKLHALSAVNSHPRPSTRVKDLIDIVLVIDAGTLDEQHLGTRLDAVFAARDSSPPPRGLPAPPAAWAVDYAVLAAGHDVSAPTLDDAVALVRSLYLRTLDRTPLQEPR